MKDNIDKKYDDVRTPKPNSFMWSVDY